MNMKVKPMLLSAILSASFSAMSATEVRWTGAAGDNNMSTAANWDPQVKPSSNSTAYIAVFDGVTLDLTENTDTYWYPAGIVLKNGALVTYAGKALNSRGEVQNRAKPSDATEDGMFIIDADENSQFTFSGTIFEGLSTLDLVKRGKGTFKATSWCGNTGSASKVFKNATVEDGTFYKQARTLCVSEKITVKDGATLVVTSSDAISEGNATIALNPQIVVEKGGTIDGNKATIMLPSLSGAGVVRNLSASGVTIHLHKELGNLTFSGKIEGKFTVVPATDADAACYMIVGAKESLEFADLSVVDTRYLRFAPGIGRFYVKAVPEGEFLDTNGDPVVLTLDRDYYVNCNLASSGDGRTPETAFVTLQEAMENAALKAGDTVYVLPGVYDQGEMAPSATSLNKSRVIVKAGVSLVSTEGAERTTIRGQASSSPVKADCGEGALRCVKLNDGCLLKGFTLTGGHTYCVEYNKGAYYGGGVEGDTTGECRVEDCVISGCSAVRGGGVCHVTCVRCRLENNEATYLGAAASEAEFYNCVFSGHENGTYTTMYSSVVNCTFFADNKVNATWSQSGSSDILGKNCIFLCRAGRDAKNYQNCLFTTTSGVSDANKGTGSRILAAADLLIKPTGCLRWASPAVDKGDDTLYPVSIGGKMDFAGRARKCGDSIDIGAYELNPSDVQGTHVIIR